MFGFWGRHHRGDPGITLAIAPGITLAIRALRQTLTLAIHTDILASHGLIFAHPALAMKSEHRVSASERTSGTRARGRVYACRTAHTATRPAHEERRTRGQTGHGTSSWNVPS